MQHPSKQVFCPIWHHKSISQSSFELSEVPISPCIPKFQYGMNTIACLCQKGEELLLYLCIIGWTLKNIYALLTNLWGVFMQVFVPYWNLFKWRKWNLLYVYIHSHIKILNKNKFMYRWNPQNQPSKTETFSELHHGGMHQGCSEATTLIAVSTIISIYLQTC